MRKILLGTTAVVGTALLGTSFAQAQEAPTVRIGGYFRAYYGYTQQTGTESVVANTLPLGPAGSGGSQGVPSAANRARLGKSDFSTDAEVHVFVNGKAANGLTYGAVIEIQFDQQEGRSFDEARGSTSKTTADLDEAYAFIASPTFGQIRFGDEDGPMGGLMTSGVITNFGTGGVYGDWEDFVSRQRASRTTTSPGSVGDNTKIIYLSPQFFGFDFGASFAFNYSEGADTGCVNNVASGVCDRAYAFTGANNVNISPAQGGFAARRNEYQAMARWRGSFGGVGLAVSGGYMGSGSARELTPVLGTQSRTLNGLNVWEIGAQATAFGFTVGGHWKYGDTGNFWLNTRRGDRPMNEYFVGASYTAGPFTIGANYVFGTMEGNSRLTYSAAAADATGGRNPFVLAPAADQALQRRWGFGVGANYRIAPGMDLVAEYVAYRVREGNRDLDAVQPGVQNRASADVFLTGVRLAF